jgi:phage-related protein
MKGHEVVNSKGQITDQKAFNKALFSLMDERFKGGTAMQATSFKGLMSTLSGTFKTTLATMAGISQTGEVKAGGFFDKLKHAIQGLNETLDKWSKDGTLQAWADAISGAFSAAFDFVTDLLSGVKSVVKYVGDNIPVSKKTIQDFWDSYKKDAHEVSEFIKTDVIPTTKDFAKTVKENMGEAKFDTEQFHDTIKSLGQVFHDVYDIAKPLFTDVIGVYIGQAIDGATNVINGFIGTLKNMLDMIHTGIKALDDLAHFRNPVYNSMAPEQAPGPTRAISAHGHNANGTDNWRGGTTWVGERGPEIVNLPKGSQVIPNHKINQPPPTDNRPMVAKVIMDSKVVARAMFNKSTQRGRLVGGAI